MTIDQVLDDLQTLVEKIKPKAYLTPRGEIAIEKVEGIGDQCTLLWLQWQRRPSGAHQSLTAFVMAKYELPPKDAWTIMAANDNHWWEGCNSKQVTAVRRRLLRIFGLKENTL